MVLDDKGAVKAERLGLDVVFDEIAEAFAAVELGAAAPRRRTAEQAELHGIPPPLIAEALCASRITRRRTR